MAKRRKVTDQVDTLLSSPESHAGTARSAVPIAAYAAVSFLSAVVVYTQYHPSDSVAVERGDALGFVLFSLVLLCVWSAGCGFQQWYSARDSASRTTGAVADHVPGRVQPQSGKQRWLVKVLDLVPWMIAGWMVLAAFATCPPGNLRSSTNEAWVWISAAAMFFACRRLFASLAVRRAVMGLLLGCALAQSVHALHQQFISLPETRRDYEADPQRVLALSGIEAPEGSAERIVFENRLYDGGPTGTFALANSLAAVLLLGVVVSCGVLRFRFFELGWSGRVLWIALLGCLIGALIATRSRSAVLAMLFGAAVIFYLSMGPVKRHRSAWLFGLFSIGGAAVVTAILALGKGEWVEQAPASLSFRFQYWRATLRMVHELPLFGAGPGNFQAIYPRYREASASEQIADPHHFFFETLASGGWVAAALLVLLISALASCGVARKRQLSNERRIAESHGVTEPSSTSLLLERFCWLGACVGLLLVWLIGLMRLEIPDLDAHTFAIPAAFAAVVLSSKSLRELSASQLDCIAASVLVALMIHLSISSGWTIPGVAILVWLMSAMIGHVGFVRLREQVPAKQRARPIIQQRQPEPPEALRQESGSPNPSAPHCSPICISSLLPLPVVAAVSVVLLFCLVLGSLRPVRQERTLLADAAGALSRGRFLQADQLLEQAALADRWSDMAVRWHSESLLRRLVGEAEENERLRQSWEALVQKTKQRAGENPAVYRELGIQQLHVYQRFGRQRDLDAALETFRNAVQQSPTDVWLVAQLSEVAGAAGDQDFAEELAKQAKWLSGLKANMVRDLQYQLILPARSFGPSTATGSVRGSAKELLFGTVH